jgi:uncharacterized protein (DUF433 family)
MVNNRITRHPNIMAGVACISGTRIPVATVVGMVRSGMSEEEILADFPQLTADDIAAAVDHDANLHGYGEGPEGGFPGSPEGA